MIECEFDYLDLFRQKQEVERAIYNQKVLLSSSLCTRTQRLHAEVAMEINNFVLCDMVSQLKAWDNDVAWDRVGDWFVTYSGKRFWLEDPRPEDICIEDIAQNLSGISRWNGSTEGRAYTVAQHSVMASVVVPKQFQLPVLMHDTPEAYAGDVVTPLKRLLGDIYGDIEEGIMGAISYRYDFAWEDKEVQKMVKHADFVMLATEVRDLVPYGVINRTIYESPLPGRIKPWSQRRAKLNFIKRFRELANVRQTRQNSLLPFPKG